MGVSHRDLRKQVNVLPTLFKRGQKETSRTKNIAYYGWSQIFSYLHCYPKTQFRHQVVLLIFAIQPR